MEREPAAERNAPQLIITLTIHRKLCLIRVYSTAGIIKAQLVSGKPDFETITQGLQCNFNWATNYSSILLAMVEMEDKKTLPRVPSPLTEVTWEGPASKKSQWSDVRREARVVGV